MAESTLTVNRARLLREVGRFLGIGPTAGSWPSDTATQVDDIIASGLRLFYYPPGHAWSFLRPTATLATVAADFDYTLPDDFASVAGDFTFASGVDQFRIPLVSEVDLRAMRARQPLSGPPKYVAVRPTTTAGTSVGQRWEAIFYPTPDAAYTLSYQYTVIPPTIDGTVLYPYGGAMHGETVLAAVLAVAEEVNEGTRGPYWARWETKLAASIELDKAAMEAATAPFPVAGTTVSSVGIQWSDLVAHIGRELGIGWNRTTWTHEQTRAVDEVLQEGYRQFCYPPESAVDSGHSWTFLHPTKTLALTASDAAYDLPDDFGQELDSLTYSSPSGRQPIRLVTETHLRALQARRPLTAVPEYAAVRPKPSDGTLAQRWELLLYPTPDADATLEIAYAVVPQRLTEETPHPVGGAPHAETLLASCLAVVETGKGPRGPRYERWMERLAASVRLDRRTQATGDSWSPDDSTTMEVRFADLVRTVGDYLGYGPNPLVYRPDEAARCASLVNDGLRQFYSPPPVGKEGLNHSWSFLQQPGLVLTVAPYSTGTVTVAAGVATLTGGTWPAWAAQGTLTIDQRGYGVRNRVSGTVLELVDQNASATDESYTLDRDAYDLPGDYGSLVGPLTYRPGSGGLWPPVEVMAEHQLRQRRQRDDASGRPLFAAIRSKPHVTDEATRFEVVFHPKPNDEYELRFRYRAYPLLLSAANPVPLGGVQHAEAIRCAVLAAAEFWKERRRGPLWAAFVVQLEAAVRLDRETTSPETLGTVVDPDESLLAPWRFGRHAAATLSRV